MTDNPWSLSNILFTICVGLIITIIGGVVVGFILKSDRFDPARRAQDINTVTTESATLGPVPTSNSFSTLATSPVPITPSATASEKLPPRLLLTGDVPLYQGPGNNYAISTTLISGEEVSVIAQDMSRGWFYVQRDNGSTGWVERTSGYLINSSAMHSIPEITPDSISPTPTLTSSPRPTATIRQSGGNLPVYTPSSVWKIPATLTSESQAPDTQVPTNPPYQATTPTVLVTESPPTPTPDIPPTADTP